MKVRKRKLGLQAALVLALSLFFLMTVQAAEPGWSYQEGNWYYYNQEGQLCTGWIQVGGKYYYLYPDGRCAINERTPDGYLVDGSGAWYEPVTEVLGKTLNDVVVYTGPEAPGIGWGSRKADYEKLAQGVWERFDGTRSLQIGEDSLEYVNLATGEILLGLYKNSMTGTYRLDVRALFSREHTQGAEAVYYNYEILKGMLCKITPQATELTAGIISSWQETNSYGIQRGNWVSLGGCRVRYEAGAGCGKYWITAP